MPLLVLSAVISMFLYPPIFLVRPEYALLCIGAAWGLMKFGIRPVGEIRWEVLLLVVTMCFAGATTVFQLSAPPGQSVVDWGIFVRNIVYLCALLTGYFFGLGRDQVGGGVRTGLLIIACAAVAISYVQYFNVGGVSLVMVPLYGEKYGNLAQGYSWRRIMGTMGNANYWGLVLSWIVVAGIVMAFRVSALWRIAWLALAVASFGAIFLTGSRSALLVVLVLLLVLAVTQGVSRAPLGPTRSPLNMLVVGLFVAVAVGVVVAAGFSGVYEDADRFSPKNLRTLHLRLALWQSALETWASGPREVLFGAGQQNPGMGPHFGDNMYILLLRNNGLFGLLVYVGLMVLTVVRTAVVAKTYSETVAILGFVVLLSIAIFNLSSDAWFNIRITEAALLLYGSVIGLRVRREMNSAAGDRNSSQRRPVDGSCGRTDGGGLWHR